MFIDQYTQMADKIKSKIDFTELKFITFLIFFGVSFRAAWLAMFYFLKDPTLNSREIVFDLDIYRLKIINSTNEIFLTEYNNPFYLYIFRAIKDIKFLGVLNEYYLYLLFCFVNIILYSIASILFYYCLKLINYKNYKLISIAFVLMPTAPFCADLSSEAFKVLGSCIMILASILYLNKSEAYNLLVILAVVFTGFVSLTYASCASFFLLGFLYVKMNKKNCLNERKNPSYLSILVYISIGLLTASIARHLVFDDQLIHVKVIDYHLTYNFRNEEDFLRSEKKLIEFINSFGLPIQNIQTFTLLWSFLTKLSWSIQGILYPHFGQFLLFDQAHWVLFYGILLNLTVFKLLILLFSLQSLFINRSANYVNVLLIILLLFFPSFYWGPNFDSVRISSSLLPFLFLLVCNIKSIDAWSYSKAFLSVVGTMLVVLSISVIINHNRFEISFDKLIVIIFSLVIFIFYTVFFKYLINKIQ